MPINIYIVQGHTGEYSDHTEWLVRAFYNEAEAQAEVNRLSTAYRVIFGCEPDAHPKGGYVPYLDRRHVEMRKYDPEFRMDYTGAGWDVLTTEVMDHPA